MLDILSMYSLCRSFRVENIDIKGVRDISSYSLRNEVSKAELRENSNNVASVMSSTCEMVLISKIAFFELFSLQLKMSITDHSIFSTCNNLNYTLVKYQTYIARHPV